jgi:hypothetical protein
MTTIGTPLGVRYGHLLADVDDALLAVLDQLLPG